MDTVPNTLWQIRIAILKPFIQTQGHATTGKCFQFYQFYHKNEDAYGTLVISDMSPMSCVSCMGCIILYPVKNYEGLKISRFLDDFSKSIPCQNKDFFMVIYFSCVQYVQYTLCDLCEPAETNEKGSTWDQENCNGEYLRFPKGKADPSLTRVSEMNSWSNSRIYCPVSSDWFASQIWSRFHSQLIAPTCTQQLLFAHFPVY